MWEDKNKTIPILLYIVVLVESQLLLNNCLYVESTVQHNPWVPACAGMTEKKDGSDESDPYHLKYSP